jgi:valyl-tRNA synthetase
MMHLDEYSAGPLDPSAFAIEDRWILSRLSTVINHVTNSLEHYHYAEAARELYAFAWEDFCSSYLEILKERFADPDQRLQAQRMLAHTLDQLLRLLHPIMPFITEEIWQKLADFAPSRGCPIPHEAASCLIVEEWPLARKDDQDPAIEDQFALFQAALAAVRKIRSDQNLPPKKEIHFAIRGSADIAASLQPLLRYFPSMAKAECTGISESVESPTMNATVTLPAMEIVVNLEGLIDKEAECKRLAREREKLVKTIAGKQNKLANEKFVSNAPADIVQRERDSLDKMADQLKSVEESMSALGCN